MTAQDPARRFALDVVALSYSRELTVPEVEGALSKLGLGHLWDQERDPFLLTLFEGVAHGRATKLALLVEELTLALIRRGVGPAGWSDIPFGPRPDARELTAAFSALGITVLDTLADTIAAARRSRLGDKAASLPEPAPRRASLLSRCFVIMPFGKTEDEKGRSREVYDALIGPAIEEARVESAGAALQAFRVDLEVGPGAITPEIVDHLAFAPVVVADTTASNANVFYELGVRHALNSPTIVIKQAGSGDPPFDTHDVRRFEYEWPGTAATTQRFRVQMAEALHEAVRFPDRPDSTVSRTLDGLPDFWRRAPGEGADCHALGLLRYERLRAGWECSRILRTIAEAMDLYCPDHDGCLPPGDGWAGAIAPYLAHTPHPLPRKATARCPVCGSYRINERVAGRPRLGITRPAKVPLLFDSALEPGVAGGTPGDACHPTGYNILFVDGSVRSVQPEYLHRIQWDA